MNKKIYKTFILFLIGSFGLIAQSEKKYQKTFSVDKNTQLLFQTQNIDVTFKTWNKNEVKVDFTVDFQNYSKEEIKKISEAIIISAQMETSMGNRNTLQIRNASATSIGKLSYHLTAGEIHVENLSWIKDQLNKYKSVADIHNEIDTSIRGFHDLDGYIVFEDGKVPLKDIGKSTRKEIKSIQSKYEIFVPAYMAIELAADNANVKFDGNFYNVIRGSFQESDLSADVLNNNGNSIQFMNGNVRIKKIKGGNFSFRNVRVGLFGTIENATLQTEFSKINIGELTKNVQLKDFKSKFFFYNLHNDFESISMLCEYSDIRMYIDQDQKYYMEAVGHNAVLKDGETKIIMQPNKEGKRFKMFTRGKDNEAYRKNTFKLDLIHGFVTLFYNK